MLVTKGNENGAGTMAELLRIYKHDRCRIATFIAC